MMTPVYPVHLAPFGTTMVVVRTTDSGAPRTA
jgi:hypothetical protein